MQAEIEILDALFLLCVSIDVSVVKSKWRSRNAISFTKTNIRQKGFIFLGREFGYKNGLSCYQYKKKKIPVMKIRFLIIVFIGCFLSNSLEAKLCLFWRISVEKYKNRITIFCQSGRLVRQRWAYDKVWQKQEISSERRLMSGISEWKCYICYQWLLLQWLLLCLWTMILEKQVSTSQLQILTSSAGTVVEGKYRF